MKNNYIEITRKQALIEYLKGKTIFVCAIGFNPNDDISVYEFTNHFGVKVESQKNRFYKLTRGLYEIEKGISYYIERGEK